MHEEIGDADDIGMTAMSILHDRLGFAFRSQTTTFPTALKKQWTLSKAMRVIGDGKRRPTFTVPVGAEVAAIQFIMHLDAVGHPDNSFTDIPASLCDIYSENPDYIANIRSSIRVQIVKAEGCPMYVLHHRDEECPPWLLAVTDSVTALQAVRSNPNSIHEIVLRFIRSRTSFRTLKKSRATVVAQTTDAGHKRPRTPRRRIGLGERPIGHRPNISDYAAYEGARAQLLVDQRIARAAIKRGGILSRLVGNSVDDCDILDGPSMFVNDLPLQVYLNEDGNKITYIDDDISEQEISVLVGLYSIRPGK